VCRPRVRDLPCSSAVALFRCTSCLVRSSRGKPRFPVDPIEPRSSRCPDRDPHPDWGSRKPRDISFILVITGVEAGENPRPRRSATRSTCWPVVGGRPRPVVDTWTSRRPCTRRRRRPRPVPCLPPVRPQAVRRRSTGRRRPHQGFCKTAGQRPELHRTASTVPAACARAAGGRSGEQCASVTRREPVRTRIPNLCTSLGTTSRRVDRSEPADRPSTAPDVGERHAHGSPQLWRSRLPKAG